MAVLRRLTPTEVELEIVVKPEEFARARDAALRKAAARFRWPGFRTGHVPRAILERQLGSETLDARAVEELLPAAYEEALKEHELEPVERPQFDVDEPYGVQHGLRARARVSVRPEVRLGEYKGIPVRRPPTAVSDEDVDRSLEELRRQAAVLEPVEEGGVAEGDYVRLDYEGRVEGRVVDGARAVNHTTEVRPGRLLPGLAEGLYGQRAGETRVVDVTLPEDYPVPDVAGKRMQFTITVHEIKRPVLPECNDDFARAVLGRQTLAELRDDLRVRLEAAAAARARREMQRQIVEALLASHPDVPVPGVLVEHEIDNLVADAGRHAHSEGDVAGKTGLAGGDQAQREALRSEAERRVRIALLLEAIARREGLEATSADIEAEIALLARSSGRSPTAVLEALRAGTGVRPLVNVVRRSKALNFLVEQAQVTDASVTVAAQSA
jgi:trigger factor